MHIQNFWYAEFLTPSVFIYHPCSSPCFPCLSRFPPSSHFLIFASLTIFSWSYDTVFPPPLLTFTNHLFLTCQGNCVTLLSHQACRDSPSLNISKGSNPQHDPIICFLLWSSIFPCQAFLVRGLDGFYSHSLMGIRDPSLLEVLISVAVLLSTDFESTHLHAW